MELVYQYLFRYKECMHLVNTYLRTEPYGDSSCVAIYYCHRCGQEFKDE